MIFFIIIIIFIVSVYYFFFLIFCDNTLYTINFDITKLKKKLWKSNFNRKINKK